MPIFLLTVCMTCLIITFLIFYMVGSMRENANQAHRGFSKGVVSEIISTVESLIIALILALVFMEFVLQAFRIPTGSMADTLKGDHFRLVCRQCGYKYNCGYEPENVRTSGMIETRCPNCKFHQNANFQTPIAGGDRILVMKFIYQFFEPKRWDVAVFKDPSDPRTNFIKRLIGKPYETVQIVDGDIYINSSIARKPAEVQRELWMLLYDNDYQPIHPEEGYFSGGKWRQPFVNRQNSDWRTDSQNPTIFQLKSKLKKLNFLEYNPLSSAAFRATYAYDDVNGYNSQPFCSDLKVRFWFDNGNSSAVIGAELSKYGIIYRGCLRDSKLVIERLNGNKSQILAEKIIDKLIKGKVVSFCFQNVDHLLTLRVDNTSIFADLGKGMDDAGKINHKIPPTAAVFAAGSVTIRHLAVFRDIHYTETALFGAKEKNRATRENPFVLEKDQYFMLGDNSPGSSDSRLWEKIGIGNSGKHFPKGIVPSEYLMGKALFVYWPAGFRPYKKFQFGFVPNIADMRLIYGGSKESY